MISYLGSLVQFSPGAGRCRQTSLCVGSTRRVLATLGLPRTGVSVLSRLPCSGSRLLYMERALQFQFSGPPQKRGFSCACVLCLPRPERFRQPEAWAPSPRMRHLFPLWRTVRAARGLGILSPDARAFSLCGERPRQPEARAPSPRMRRTISLRGPSAHRW